MAVEPVLDERSGLGKDYTIHALRGGKRLPWRARLIPFWGWLCMTRMSRFPGRHYRVRVKLEFDVPVPCRDSVPLAGKVQVMNVLVRDQTIRQLVEPELEEGRLLECRGTPTALWALPRKCWKRVRPTAEGVYWRSGNAYWCVDSEMDVEDERRDEDAARRSRAERE